MSRPRTRRLFVISDLHLGGKPPCMMSRPDRLATFIRSIAEPGADETVELVIAGDFVDYLAVALPGGAASPWTPRPAEAVAKLDVVMKDRSFGDVFDALGAYVARRHPLTILLGNHDVELALPQVQEALLRRLGATPHDVLFVDDGRAYRVGGVLIEHGNRYDDANQNDLTHLRAIASALSRGEEPMDELEVSAGSLLVHRLVNPLKKHYPFVDLLKPEGELLVLLLLVLEPAVVRSALPQMARVVHAQRLARRNVDGRPPGTTTNVGARDEEEDVELAAAFGDEYRTLRSPPTQVGMADLIPIVLDLPVADSMKVLLDQGKTIPKARLQRIRTAMRRMLAIDRTFERDWNDPKDALLGAAKRMLTGDVEVVVMGHTHLAREIHVGAGRMYINTGTWADLVSVPADALAEGKDAELTDFLKRLCKDEARTQILTFADITLGEDGRVREARLRDHE
ncbi:metallophosphoesterase [Sorangium sp. So ce1014]|uniref:metallophosphoesterase n=1 Tax=Sorangium sp. So ce1014 TaxID=3133326 RepID=UPI003F6197FF